MNEEIPETPAKAADSPQTAADLFGTPTGTHTHPTTHPLWMPFNDGDCIVCDAQRAQQ